MTAKNHKHNPIYAAFVFGLIFSFLGSCLYMPQAYADGWALPHMPTPGVLLRVSPPFTPAYLRGITIHPENPLNFDFIIDKGDSDLTNEQKQVQYKNLIKYFLASLAVPNEEQWVNLSPYEKDRIISSDFGKTEMGRDLLAQDYILKQMTASLIYPEDQLGKKFWDKVYTKAYQQYGTTNVPVNTFNKVWIVPDDALVYEKGNSAFVIKDHLKVMLEEDYLSLKNHTAISTPRPDQEKEVNKIGSQVVREIVLPALENEVNEGKNFAMLRQVFSGMVLAAWFKQTLRQSLLGQVYVNKTKIKGVDQDPRTNEAIYRQYLKAYKKGVYNYIKEDTDKFNNESIPRKYFAGGVENDFTPQHPVRTTNNLKDFQAAMTSQGGEDAANQRLDIADVNLDNVAASTISSPVNSQPLLLGGISGQMRMMLATNLPLSLGLEHFQRFLEQLPPQMTADQLLKVDISNVLLTSGTTELADGVASVEEQGLPTGENKDLAMSALSTAKKELAYVKKSLNRNKQGLAAALVVGLASLALVNVLGLKPTPGLDRTQYLLAQLIIGMLVIGPVLPSGVIVQRFSNFINRYRNLDAAMSLKTTLVAAAGVVAMGTAAVVATRNNGVDNNKVISSPRATMLFQTLTVQRAVVDGVAYTKRNNDSWVRESDGTQMPNDFDPNKPIVVKHVSNLGPGGAFMMMQSIRVLRTKVDGINYTKRNNDSWVRESDGKQMSKSFDPAMNGANIKTSILKAMLPVFALAAITSSAAAQQGQSTITINVDGVQYVKHDSGSWMMQQNGRLYAEPKGFRPTGQQENKLRQWINQLRHTSAGTQIKLNGVSLTKAQAINKITAQLNKLLSDPIGAGGIMKAPAKETTTEKATITTNGHTEVYIRTNKGPWIRQSDHHKMPKNFDPHRLFSFNTHGTGLVAALNGRMGRPTDVGGIDLNAANMKLLIKRDGKGMILPISQAILNRIKINGLVPVILSIRPAADTPLMSELQG